jgi:anti-anti-sigma factor
MMPPSPFSLTTETVPDGMLVGVQGDLDHETCDELVGLVRNRLSTGPRPPALRLDFERLGAVDSMGLSALLMVRRLTQAAGVALRLDRRPAQLDRLLDLTGTRAHLTDTALPHDTLPHDTDPMSGRFGPTEIGAAESTDARPHG